MMNFIDRFWYMIYQIKLKWLNAVSDKVRIYKEKKPLDLEAFLRSF